MSPLDDATLRDLLEQRVRSSSLTGDERDQILGAVAADRTTPRRAAAWTLSGGRWLGFAAAGLSLILVVAVVLKPPTDQGPAGPTPTASSPGAAASPSPETGQPPVVSADQLVRMAYDSRWLDAVVLAQARIDVQALIEQFRRGFGQCIEGQPCIAAVLGDVDPTVDVYVGWRSAADGQGTRFEEDGVVHWRQPLSIPSEAGLFAFRIRQNSVEYLGSVQEDGDQALWTVGAVEAGGHADPSDDLYAVHGWLARTPNIRCVLPRPNADMAYWCGGSFVTAEPVDPHVEGGILVDLGGLRVQSDSYEEFAQNPSPSGSDSPEPRLGTYLVRSIGCPVGVNGECPVWSMVGRLDNVIPPAEGSPEPTSPPTNQLTWSFEPFLPEVDASPAAIGAIAGRMIVTGRDQVGPAAWYSDDDGATWQRASIPDDEDRRRSAMGTITGNDARLLSLGWVYLGGGNGNDADRRSVLWTSTDRGTTWERLPDDVVPPRLHDLVSGGPGFVAVGNANPSNHGLPDLEPPHAAVWLSVDGQNWEQLPDEDSFDFSRMNAIAERDEHLMAVGSVRVNEDDLPAVWTSSDGREWTRIELSDSPGAVLGIAPGPDGFVAVGTSHETGAHAVAWRSSDGVIWTERTIGPTVSDVATDVAVTGFGYVAVVKSTQSSDGSGSIWFAPVGGVPALQSISADIGDIVGIGNRFVGVGSGCTPFPGAGLADCFTSSYLAVGIPVAGAQ